MTFKDIAADATSNVATWASVTILGGMVWVVRRVFTNQKQIELLQADLKSREEMRQRDREDFAEVKSDLKELRQDVKGLYQGHGD